MMDLISRQAAIKAIDDLPNCYNGYSDTYDKAYIIGVLEEQPRGDVPDRKVGERDMFELIDAVPVVRCKDCKHSELWHSDRRRCFLWCETGNSVWDDGYCSYGERSEKC